MVHNLESPIINFLPLVHYPIQPKPQISNLGHDYALSTENFMLMKYFVLFQLPGNWPTTKKWAPYFRSITESSDETTPSEKKPTKEV
jgi:hypothetical protein